MKDIVIISQFSGSFEEIKYLCDEFEKVIKPLYGDQSNAINKILASADRTNKLLKVNGKFIGILVFKSNTLNEFKGLGYDNVLEIKTLFLSNSDTNSGKGYASLLLREVQNEALKLKATYIVVTVSENRNDSLEFFKRKGFQKVSVMNDKYIEGVNELLLIYSM
jgi:ribosomal protein S18 acetylase RimI-like enzyme